MRLLDSFATSLEQSLQLAARLESVMLEETGAIEGRQLEALERAVYSQQDLVARLEAETTRQRHWVEEAGHAFSPAGLSAFFDQIDEQGRLLQIWSRLRESIGRCDAMNKVNARLIERDRRRVTLSLRILTGDDGSSATYDTHGRTSSGGAPGRTISRA